MKIGIYPSACLLLAGCVSTPPPVDRAAVEDFIVVQHLERVDSLRTGGDSSSDVARHINDYHLRYKSRRKYYLVAFMHRCPPQYGTVTTDVRIGNTLTARSDTIRGCRIDRIYRMSREQAVELQSLGTAPSLGGT